MTIIRKFLIVAFLLFLTSQTNAHVEHYKDLNLIEFNIYRNNKNIGKHIFSFNRSNGALTVKSVIDFEIKKFGIVLYKYKAQGTEFFKDGKLVKFNSKTKQNNKDKYVDITREDENYLIDGSSFKGKTKDDVSLGTWWDHSITTSKAQISAISGRIIKQKVTFLGKEKINLNGKSYDTLHFNFSSIDKKLDKNKKLNTDVWYDEKNLNWIKASFNKNGKWEYRLVLIK